MTRGLLGSAVVALGLVGSPVAALATTTTTTDACGGGRIELLHGEGPDLDQVVGARITGIGAACDGQPVGVRFSGNEQGDPALPADELARAHSDEDPCTGEDVESGGVLVDGAVDVLLCEGSENAGWVDGRRLTSMRLLTTAGVAPGGADPVPDPAPDPASDPDPAPTGDDDLAVTGSDPFGAALLGGASVLVGLVLLRGPRRFRDALSGR